MARSTVSWREVGFDEAFQRLKLKAFEIPTKDYQVTGTYPIIDQGDGAVAGYIDREDPISDVPFIVFGDHTTIVKYVDQPCFIGSQGVVPLKARECYDPYFLYLMLGRTRIPALGYSRHFRELENKTFPLPPLAEQRKIAEILRTWDEAIETAEAELKAKQERKQWLIAKVLKSSSNEAGAVGVKKAPTERLGKLCDICTGKKDANEGSPDGVYPFFTCAERHGFSESYSFDAEAILVAGNANIGRTNYYKGKFEAYQRTYVLTGFRGVDVPYLYSLLSARLELDLKNQAQRSAMSYIRLPMLEDYQIPLPPIAEQRKIAEIMKCADMDIGLVDKHLESLRAQKRGLVQKLLTGEVRVAA